MTKWNRVTAYGQLSQLGFVVIVSSSVWAHDQESACNGEIFDYPYWYHLPEGKRDQTGTGVLDVLHSQERLIAALIFTQPNNKLLQ
jgi:hypothetical protein